MKKKQEKTMPKNEERTSQKNLKSKRWEKKQAAKGTL